MTAPDDLFNTALLHHEAGRPAEAVAIYARVLALEPSRFRTPRFLRDAAPMRQAKRLKLPGRPRLVVLYHPIQYPLARALLGRYGEGAPARLRLGRRAAPLPSSATAADTEPAAELWYFRPRWEGLKEEAGHTRQQLLELDGLAAERAAQVLPVAEELRESTDKLYDRLRELEVISSRPFVPGGRVVSR